MKRPSWAVIHAVVFALVVASFGAATILAQWRAAAIDREALLIADHASPTIKHLSEARGELVQLRALLRESLGAKVEESQLADSRARIDAAISQYARSAPPADRVVGERVSDDKATLFRAIDAFCADLRETDLVGARDTLNGTVAPAAVALDEVLGVVVATNASRSETAARDIRRIRTSSLRLATVLDAVSVVVAIAAAVILRRAIRAHGDVLSRLHAASEARANELDAFAGRIAHDLRNPLGVVAFALEAAGRDCGGADREKATARGQRAVKRMTTLIEGLLGFARAGARVADGQSDVRETVSDVVDDLKAAAERARAEVHVEIGRELKVGCPKGILASILSNLTGNAIKYLSDAPQRHVSIRARRVGDTVRLEVEDTGPGIAPDLQARIFEPFVRAARGTEEGVGLGLATVRRLVEGCGGSVGVRSRSGGGSTFWVVLPMRDERGHAASGNTETVET